MINYGKQSTNQMNENKNLWIWNVQQNSDTFWRLRSIIRKVRKKNCKAKKFKKYSFKGEKNTSPPPIVEPYNALEDKILIYHILLAKYYSYKCGIENKQHFLSVFQYKIKTAFVLKLKIAVKK